MVQNFPASTRPSGILLGDALHKKLTRVNHAIIDNYIYRQKCDPIAVFRTLEGVLAQLSLPGVIERYETIVPALVAITPLVDGELMNRILSCDIGRMRYLEYKLLDQFVLLANCVDPLSTSDTDDVEAVLSVESAMVDLGGCIQSIQKWFDKARSIPRLQVLNSHALHSTENRKTTVQAGTRRVFLSAIANALVDIATNQGVLEDYRNILSRQATTLAIWAGIIDRINPKNLMEAADDAVYKNIQYITSILHKLSTSRDTVLYISRNTVRDLISSFLTPTLKIASLRLKPSEFVNTASHEDKNKLKTLCNPYFLAILNLTEASYALHAIEDMYKRYPALRRLYRTRISNAKRICRELVDTIRALQSVYCIKSIALMEVRSALGRYSAAISRILSTYLAHRFAIVPDNFESLLQKTTIYCFYSDMLYLRDPPVTPEDIAVILEEHMTGSFNESAFDNDMAYVDVDAVLATGLFTTQEMHREGNDSSTNATRGTTEPSTSYESLSYQQQSAAPGTLPPPPEYTNCLQPTAQLMAPDITDYWHYSTVPSNAADSTGPSTSFESLSVQQQNVAMESPPPILPAVHNNILSPTESGRLCVCRN